MDEPNDEELLMAWRDGDTVAGNRLINRHVDLLYRFFRYRAGSQTADLAQRTLLAAVEARDRVPSDVGFRPYLLGIARNQLLMFQRSSARRAGALAAKADSGPTRDGATPSGVLASRDEQRLLLRGLRRLPLDMQLTIELFYWEGLSRAEIATVLEVEAVTIKSRLQRAKSRLREILLEIGGSVATATATDLEQWARSMKIQAAERKDDP